MFAFPNLSPVAAWSSNHPYGELGSSARCLGEGHRGRWGARGVKMHNPSRRAFLRGKVGEANRRLMRPPGAEPGFGRLCDGCGSCAAACPEGIITGSVSTGPVVRLDTGACTFCQDCARACPTGALAVTEHPGWDWRARVGASCLSMNGIACRACEDACDNRAIRFRLMTGGRAAPGIDLDQCTGCGACSPVCPAGAIGFCIPEPAREVRA